MLVASATQPRCCQISAGRRPRWGRHRRNRLRWKRYPLAFLANPSALAAALRFGGLLAAVKVERGAVHAVAQAGGLRTIVKYVAEVTAALAAMHFGTGHEKTAVGLRLDCLLNRRREARPAGAAVEFGVRGKQRLAATGAAVDALAILLVERARSRAFGAVVAQHSTCRRRKLAPPLFFAHRDRKFLGRRMSSAAEAAQQALCHDVSSRIRVRRNGISDRRGRP